MSPRKAGEGALFGLGLVAVLGVGAFVGWRMLGPEILALAGAAGAQAGERAGEETSEKLGSAAPGIGAQIGSSAGPAAVSSGIEAAKGIAVGEPTPYIEDTKKWDPVWGWY